MSTDYEQFYAIGGALTGFGLECWVCDEVLPWEEPDGCLSLGEMVRLADAHWVVHPDGVAPERPAVDPGPTPVFRMPMHRREPAFTGISGLMDASLREPSPREPMTFGTAIAPSVFLSSPEPPRPTFTGILGFLADQGGEQW